MSTSANVNPVFSSLNFHQDQDYGAPSHPYPNSVQVYNRQCGFNCICCARMQLGNYCSCAFPKQSTATQTEEYDTVPMSMVKDNLWKRGTSEHAALQRMINSTIEKYQLVSAKDRHLPAAVSEIRNYLSVNSTLETVEEKKISDRLKKSLEWRRYYAKKRSHATSNGLPVRHVIKKKKSGSDKENRQPSPTDEEPLLQGDLGSDLHDVGVDNRGFDPDTDSDSDVPLSTLATRKKKSL